jgi:hypothetical protein
VVGGLLRAVLRRERDGRHGGEARQRFPALAGVEQQEQNDEDCGPQIPFYAV